MAEINKNANTLANVDRPVNKWLIICLVISLAGSIALWYRLYYIAIGVAFYGFSFILILPGTALTIINLIIIPIVNPPRCCYSKFIERSDSTSNSSSSNNAINHNRNSSSNSNSSSNNNNAAKYVINDNKQLINGQFVTGNQTTDVYHHQRRHININKTLTALLWIIISKIAICGIVLLICFQTGQALQTLRIGLPSSSTITSLVKSIKVPIFMPENCHDPRLTFGGVGQQKQQAIDKITGLHSTGIFDTYDLLTLQLNQNFSESDFIKLSCSVSCGDWPINCLITNQEVNVSYNWILILLLIILLVILQALYFSNKNRDPLGLLSTNKIIPLPKQFEPQTQPQLDETRVNDAFIASNADCNNNPNPNSNPNNDVKNDVEVINETRLDINPVNSTNSTTFKQLNQPVTHLHIDTDYSTQDDVLTMHL